MPTWKKILFALTGTGVALAAGFEALDTPIPVEKGNGVVIVVDSSMTLAEVRQAFSDASTSPELYVGAYADVSAAVKAEIKTHKNITSGYWLYGDSKGKEDVKMNGLVKETSGKEPKEIRKKNL